MITLQLNDSYKPVTDGVAVCAENYARGLARRNVPAAVAVPSSPGYVDDDEFPVFRYLSLPVPGWHPYRMGIPPADMPFRRRIHRWLDGGDHRRDAVVLHTHAPFASGVLGRQLRRRLRASGRHAALVATLHSKYHEDFSRVLPEFMVTQVIAVVRRHLEAADAVWVPNSGTARTARIYGYEGEVAVIPNGSDLPAPEDGEYGRLRREGGDLLRVPADTRVLLFVGQQRREKNIGLILDALARLIRSSSVAGGQPVATSVPSWRMVLVGDGPDAQEIREEVHRLGLTGVVHFYGHVSDRRTLRALYARSDLFVFPSLYDNAPLVVREAAAHRTPSILAEGSDAAGETIDGRNAFHVAPEAEALASRIRDLLASPKRCEEVGIAAAREVYRSWDDVVEEVRERYDIWR